jgi:hypothetical protein
MSAVIGLLLLDRRFLVLQLGGKLRGLLLRTLTENTGRIIGLTSTAWILPITLKQLA